jgi:uncharacterized C2H2 Zn-finger protein
MSIDNNNREPGPFSSDMDRARRSEPIVGEVTEGSESKYRCEICGQVFMNKVDLEEHVKSHGRVQEKVQQEAVPAGVA